MSFFSNAVLQYHFRCPVQVDGVYVHQCDICQGILASREALYTHMKLKHKQSITSSSLNPYSKEPKACNFCKKILGNPTLYIDHIAANHPNEALPKNALKHISKGTGTIVCSDCQAKFKTELVYYKHRLSVHPSSSS